MILFQQIFPTTSKKLLARNKARMNPTLSVKIHDEWRHKTEGIIRGGGGGAYLAKPYSAKPESAVQESAKPYLAKPGNC